MLPIFISETEEVSEDDRLIYFRKIDIKYGFSIMLFQAGAEWNFAFVLPGGGKNEYKILVVLSSLQMRWTLSSSY